MRKAVICLALAGLLSISASAEQKKTGQNKKDPPPESQSTNKTKPNPRPTDKPQSSPSPAPTDKPGAGKAN